MESRNRDAALVLVCAAFTLSYAAPLLRRQDAAPEAPPPPAEAGECPEIEGNADFYGLGIRGGIYFQWTASLFVNHFLRDSIEDNLDTNAIFLLALFVALATSTATIPREVKAAEIVVILHLCFGFISSILSIWGYRTTTRSRKRVRFPLLGSFARLTLTTAICAYALFFWMVGVDYVDEEVPDSCPTYTFLFGRLEVTGPIKHYFQASTVLFCIVYWFLFFKEFLMINVFAVFTVLKTALLGFVFVLLSPSSPLQDFTIEGSSRRRVLVKKLLKSILFMFKTWPRLATPIIWSNLNGKESAGEKRPNISFWLQVVANFWIFVLRTSFQMSCILLTGHCPPLGLPPIIIPSIFQNTATGLLATWRLRVLELVTAKRFEAIISITNALCLVWAVVAVELSLRWNKFTDVNEIRSTGQLIPFITGLVGLVRALHRYTVEQSSVRSTDTLMELLDRDLDPSIDDDFDTHSMHDGTEAVFLKARRPARRRSEGDLAPVDREDLSTTLQLGHKYFASLTAREPDKLDSRLKKTVHRFRRDRAALSEPKETPRSSSLPDLKRAAHPDDPQEAYSFLRRSSDSSASSRSLPRSPRRSGSRSSNSQASSGSRSRSPGRLRSQRLSSTSGSRSVQSFAAGSAQDGLPAPGPSAYSRSSRDSVSDDRSATKRSRIQGALTRIFLEYRQQYPAFYHWSAQHPLRKDIIKLFQDRDKDKARGTGERADGAPPSQKPFEKRPHAPGLAAGRHNWPHRRKRHYGAAHAFWSRSLFRLLLATVRAGRDSRARAGRYAEAARLEELEAMLLQAKDIRRRRLAHAINADEQHALMAELWQKVDWRIEGEVLDFVGDVILPELMGKDEPKEEDEEEQQQGDGGAEGEKKPHPAGEQSERRLSRKEAKKLWTNAQIQHFAKTGACFDLNVEQWAARENIVILEELRSSSSGDSRLASRSSGS